MKTFLERALNGEFRDGDEIVHAFRLAMKKWENEPEITPEMEKDLGLTADEISIILTASFGSVFPVPRTALKYIVGRHRMERELMAQIKQPGLGEAGLLNEVESLRKENDRLRALISDAEWMGEPSRWINREVPGCPWCDTGEPGPGHDESCPAAREMGWRVY